MLLFIGFLTGRTQTPRDIFSKTILEDKFKAPSKYWEIKSPAKVKYGGLFHPQIKSNNSTLSIWDGKIKSIKYLSFEATVKKINGSDKSGFGLIFQSKSQNKSDRANNFYYLLINSQGEFSMGNHRNVNTLNQNIVWKKSTTINQGNKLNKLKIVCYGNKVIGWINNQRVEVLRDQVYSYGKVGVISTNNENDGVDVYFDNVIIKTKES